MKTSKIIVGLLALLGFVACEPDEEVKPGCDPNGPYFMYGSVPCAYESKAAVPDMDETVEVTMLPVKKLPTEESKEQENEKE